MPSEDVLATTTLDVALVDQLNLMQSSIGLTLGFKPVLCRKRNDGAHVPIAGAPPGVMLVSRRGFYCPVCPYRKHVSVKKADLERAQDCSEMVPLSRETLSLVRSNLADLEALSTDSLPRVIPHIKSIQAFAVRVETELSKPKYRGPAIEAFPLTFLLALHNMDDQGAIRREIIEWLEHERAVHPRNHWMDSIEVLPNGDLSYNRQLYELAVWRGKQETYFKSASNEFAGVLKALDSLSRFQSAEDENSLLAPASERLFPVRELLPDVKRLKSMAPQLQQLMDALGGTSLADVSAVLHRAIPDLQPSMLGQDHPESEG